MLEQRSSTDGKTVVMFMPLDEQSVPLGFVQRVNGSVPRCDTNFATAKITINGCTITASKVRVIKSKVIIWLFDTADSLSGRSLAHAKLLGGVAHLGELYKIQSKPGSRGYQNTETGRWMSAETAELLLNGDVDDR